MRHDFSHLEVFLQENGAGEMVKTLDKALYNIVLVAEYLESTDGMAGQYLNIMLMRNQFAILAGLPQLEPSSQWK